MITPMYAVKDELSEIFLSPVMMRNDNEALRAFKSQVNHTDIWKDNPGDFGLYRVGEYNDATGEIEPEFEKIASGRSVIE